MQRLNNRRGSSPVGIIVGLVVLALVGGGIWYYVSDPFHTHVNQAWKQGTKWTAENIKNDPVGYLTWALDEVVKTEGKLKTSEISLRTEMNKSARALEKQTADKSQYELLLTKLKDAYTTASEQKKWPTKVGEVELNEKELKRRIVQCNDKIKNTADLVDNYTKTSKSLGDKLDEIEAKLTDLDKLKNKLSTSKEIAEANKSVEDIGAIGDQLNSIIDSSKALEESAKPTGVEDMIKPSGDAKVDDEFSKIMGKSK